jgi:hypothetical protein
MIYRAITTNAINDYNKNPAVLFLEYLWIMFNIDDKWESKPCL